MAKICLFSLLGVVWDSHCYSIYITYYGVLSHVVDHKNFVTLAIMLNNAMRIKIVH